MVIRRFPPFRLSFATFFRILGGMQFVQDYRYLISSAPQRGVLCIRNLRTGMSLLVPSDDVVHDAQRIRFSLDMGTFGNADLQHEYERTGLESFAIDPMALADAKEDIDSVVRACRDKLKREGIAFYRT
jgi:hypothetical protein